MLVTKDEIKTFIGIELSDTDYDTEIEALIPDSEAMLSSVLWVESLITTKRTEWCFWDNEWATLQLYNFPVTEISKIGGEDYTGVENTDYILDGRTVEFINIPSADIINGKVIVEYTAWYVENSTDPETTSNAPDKIKLAIKYLASGLWNTKKDIAVTECKIGQEAYKFANITDQADFLKIVNQIKGKGKVVIL